MSNKLAVVVDDDRSLRNLASQVLKMLGYTVMEFENYDRLNERLATLGPVDLFYLDNSTGSDLKGFEMARLLREGNYPNSGAILYTGEKLFGEFTDSTRRTGEVTLTDENCSTWGIDRLIGKPVKVDALMATIKSIEDEKAAAPNNAPDTAAKPQEDEPETRNGGYGYADPEMANRPTILVMQKDPIMLSVQADALEKLGYRTIRCNSLESYNSHLASGAKIDGFVLGGNLGVNEAFVDRTLKSYPNATLVVTSGDVHFGRDYLGQHQNRFMDTFTFGQYLTKILDGTRAERTPLDHANRQSDQTAGKS